MYNVGRLLLNKLIWWYNSTRCCRLRTHTELCFKHKNKVKMKKCNNIINIKKKYENNK